MTVSKLRGLAKENGIVLSATRKAGIIDEIMEAQDAGCLKR